MILRYVLQIFTIFMMLFLSRTREYMADAGAVELMRTNMPMANALIKLQMIVNLQKLNTATSIIK